MSLSHLVLAWLFPSHTYSLLNKPVRSPDSESAYNKLLFLRAHHKASLWNKNGCPLLLMGTSRFGVERVQ